MNVFNLAYAFEHRTDLGLRFSFSVFKCLRGFDSW
jgi:hypothetical protein